MQIEQRQDEQRWQAVLARDTTADGAFVYAVRSTGIYCRPSCPSRRPRRDYVAFFASPAEATAAGYRACKRCRPDGAPETPSEAEAIVREARQYIEARLDETLTLAVLGAHVHLSPFHLQRLFKRQMGVSPRQYAEACRLQALKTRLQEGADVTTAQYAAGYVSSSRLYERAPQHLGMTPGQYRRGGEGATIRYATARSALGYLLVAETDRGMCAVRLGADEETLLADVRAEFPAATLTPAPDALAGILDQVIAYLMGYRTALDLPLDVEMTSFQGRVWTAIQAIPYGETRSYQEVARMIGQPTAMRSVANACARNPVALLIPCHRVVRQDGASGGYRWGAERKRRLLDLEHQAVARRETLLQEA